MESLFPLALFPEGALTHSVITTVWIGVFVVAFFNLRFGWSLSGLVIPGYLVPLMMAKPWSAVTVLIEGIITYWLVRFLSSYLSKYGKWNNLFGRDRFFALVLGSLLVRIVLDGWVLPSIGQLINATWGLNIDFSNHLRSFGLIISALIANYFWKPGLRKGLTALSSLTLITFLMVRFGLMEFTNFNIGRIEYMFEDLVTFFLASPKAYIIIIVTSFMASRMNVRYGWEYSGIMIPSLLALQWYQPLKLVATVVESAVILGIGILVMRLPMFRNVTMEGARKLLLFFNISFAYKFVLGHLLLIYAPQVQISDYYGFGYLLSTLIAIKMHQKSFLPQMTRSLIQTSLAAVAAASVIGFMLTFFSGLFAPTPGLAQVRLQAPGRLQTTLLETLRREKLVLYRGQDPRTIRLPSPPEIDTFSSALKHIRDYLSDRDPGSLDASVTLLGTLNYRVDFIRDSYLLLRENPPYRGNGVYIFRLNPDNPGPPGLVVEIPAPIDEWLVLESGAWLFQQLNGSAMAISGTSRGARWDKSTDVLINPQSYFHTFHRVIGSNNVIQVRAHTPGSLRQLEGIRGGGDIGAADVETTMWVKSELPPGLSLTGLKDLLGDYDVKWLEPPFKNMQRRQSRTGFAEIFLSRPATRKSMIDARIGRRGIAPESHVQRIDGYLREWLLGTRGEIADRGSNRYKSMTLEELLFLDREVLTPLVSALSTHYRGGGFTPEGRAEIQAIDAAASLLGYRIYWYHHVSTGQEYLLLTEREPVESPLRRFGGTYVFRLGAASPYVVQIPRPIFERNSFEYGVYLFERMKSRVLMIAGAHPHANIDYGSDVIHRGNKLSLFSLVNQVVMREAGDRALMVVACRAFGYGADRPVTSADAFIALGDWVYQPQRISGFAGKLLDTLRQDGLDIIPVDGSPETRGYEVGMVAQYRYLPQTANKEFAVLWLSPELRQHYRQQTDNRLQESRFASLGLETVETDIYRYIVSHGKRPKQGPAALPPRLKEQTGAYILYKDVVLLHAILTNPAWQDFTFTRLIDTDTKDSFLAIRSPSGALLAIANLNPRTQREFSYPKGKPVRKIFSQYINTRAMWLLNGRRP